MRHPIDPTIDCVFKALLGSEANRGLLIHFLNAILGPELPRPITGVEILNPYNEREFFSDKLSIVDVKARDDQGRLYQVEIQLLTYPDLPARILYTWADLYSQQIQSGQDYGQLQPTYAIWLVGEDLLVGDPGYAHRYRLRDERGRSLLDHGGIALFELSKFATAEIATEEQRWLKFFKDGERLDADRLPAWMHTPEMEQAMSTLQAFSEKDRAYHAYQARQNYLREQACLLRHQRHLECALAETSTALEERSATLEQTNAALEQTNAALEQTNAALEQTNTALEQTNAALEQTNAALEEERAPRCQDRCRLPLGGCVGGWGITDPGLCARRGQPGRSPKGD
jgi:predicted transposase/invertase (TIGR01784 family)